jgi:hypothetical protein
MGAELPIRRRAWTAAGWPVGVALTSWRYLWRTVPLHRTEEQGDAAADAPPSVPAGVSLEEIQPPESGSGPLFHRRYRTRIRETAMTPEELVAAVSADPSRVSPTEFAKFRKVNGEERVMRTGDEYVVHMAGPWDGPVRVIERTPTSFRLATLDGHLEAGQIEFSARRDSDLLVFEIESWARSATRVIDLLYDRLRLTKEVQLHMWTSVLQRVAELSGGRMTGGIDVETRRVHEEDGA